MFASAPLRNPTPESPYAPSAPESPAKAKTTRAEKRILDFVRSRGYQGCTDSEIQERLSMCGDSQRPRRVALTRARFIRDSGRTRKTKTGRAATVWIAVQGGSCNG